MNFNTMDKKIIGIALLSAVLGGIIGGCIGGAIGSHAGRYRDGRGFDGRGGQRMMGGNYRPYGQQNSEPVQTGQALEGQASTTVR